MSEIGYKKGYIPNNKGIQIERMDFERKNYFRPDRELLNSISEPDDDGLVQVLDTVGQDVNVAFLRPLSTPPSVLESHQIRESPGAEFETNRIFHPGKVQELCNSAFRCHSIHKPACQGELHWDDDGEIQRGLGWMGATKVQYMRLCFQQTQPVFRGAECQAWCQDSWFEYWGPGWSDPHLNFKQWIECFTLGHEYSITLI